MHAYNVLCSKLTVSSHRSYSHPLFLFPFVSHLDVCLLISCSHHLSFHTWKETFDIYFWAGERWVISLNTVMSNYINFSTDSTIFFFFVTKENSCVSYFHLKFLKINFIYYGCFVCTWFAEVQGNCGSWFFLPLLGSLGLNLGLQNLHSRCFYFRATSVTHATFFLYPYICLWVPRRAPYLGCHG